MVLSAFGGIEYIIEATPGTCPTNPAMAWIGRVQKADIENLTNNEDVRSLKAFSATNKAEIAGNFKTGESGNFKLEYMPQDTLTFMRAWLNDDAGTTQKDSIDSFTLALQSADATPKYATAQGCYGADWMCDISEDKFAKVNASGIYMHMPRATNDPWYLAAASYIGSGSHATESTSAPISWSNISTLTFGGAAINATNIKFGIKNTLIPVKSGGSTNSTKIASVGLAKRDYVFSAKVRRDEMHEFAVNALGYADGTNIVLTLDLGTDITLTFHDAKIPYDKYNLNADGLSEMDVTFTGITELVLS